MLALKVSMALKKSCARRSLIQITCCHYLNSKLTAFAQTMVTMMTSFLMYVLQELYTPSKKPSIE